MSYYRRNNSVSWEFFIALIILLILLLGIRSCASYKVWNDGICAYCGGHYQFYQVVGHRDFTNYIYICDKCGRSIETAHHYLEVQDEATTY